MAQYHHQASSKRLGGELDAADLRGGNYIAGHADHEQVAEPLIEHDFRWHARVRAAENDGERFLAYGQDAPTRARDVATAQLGDDPPVALLQGSECSLCGNHVALRDSPDPHL